MDLFNLDMCGNQPVALELDIVVKGFNPGRSFEEWSGAIQAIAANHGQSCLQEQTDSLSQCASLYESSCIDEVRFRP